MPSDAQVKKLCDKVAKFYVDRGISFPSKSAMKAFSDECFSSYYDVESLMKSAFSLKSKQIVLPKNVHAWNEDHVCKWLVSVDRDVSFVSWFHSVTVQ